MKTTWYVLVTVQHAKCSLRNSKSFLHHTFIFLPFCWDQRNSRFLPKKKETLGWYIIFYLAVFLLDFKPLLVPKKKEFYNKVLIKKKENYTSGRLNS